MNEDHATALAEVSEPVEMTKDQQPGEMEIDPRRKNASGSKSLPATEEMAAPLFSAAAASEFRVRWDNIQAGFVDEPRQAVEQADGLVADAMKRLTETFTSERAKLEEQWGRDENVSTENLRLALRRYRSFFGRLLSV